MKIDSKVTSPTLKAWPEEMKHAFRKLSDLYQFFNIPFQQDSDHLEQHYPLFIPQWFAQKIKKDVEQKGVHSALWKQFVPNLAEINPSLQKAGYFDPIGDQKYGQKGLLIHRYKNRALFLPTTTCPVTCRYCFRKNELAAKDELKNSLFDRDFTATLNYLSTHPEIEEIIFSGGDPLILSDEKLAYYLHHFSQVPHIKYIRFHTRTPVILPSRINQSFIQMLQSFQSHFKKMQLVIHINHADEFSTELKEALCLLYAERIEVLSQTVLLKDVNNQAATLSSLFTELIDLQVRPYYLHHPDQVKGGMHFYLSLEEGRKIYSELRNQLPGWAIPQYIIDIPEGEGKTSAYNPEQFTYSGYLINKKGERVLSPSPLI